MGIEQHDAYHEALSQKASVTIIQPWPECASEQTFSWNCKITKIFWSAPKENMRAQLDMKSQKGPKLFKGRRRRKRRRERVANYLKAIKSDILRFIDKLLDLGKS